MRHESMQSKKWGCGTTGAHGCERVPSKSMLQQERQPAITVGGHELPLLHNSHLFEAGDMYFTVLFGT